MSEELGPFDVDKGDEEALQKVLDEVEQGIRDTWDGKWESKPARVEAFITPQY